MLHQGDARCGARPSTIHIDGVARASSAGTKSGSNARSLVLLTMLPPVSRTARFKDQLQLDDEVNSQIADGYATGSSARRGVAVGDLPTSSVSRQHATAVLYRSALRSRLRSGLDFKRTFLGGGAQRAGSGAVKTKVKHLFPGALQIIQYRFGTELHERKAAQSAAGVVVAAAGVGVAACKATAVCGVAGAALEVELAGVGGAPPPPPAAGVGGAAVLTTEAGVAMVKAAAGGGVADVGAAAGTADG
eukprot:scaffold85989_cov64-Phaeocystis_antarctica.AAC.1